MRTTFRSNNSTTELLQGTLAMRRLVTCGRTVVAGTGTKVCVRLSPRAFSSFKEFPGVPRVGLINEHCTDEFYTTKLDFSTVGALLTDRAQLMAAVDKDAEVLGVKREEYLTNVKAAMREFVESKELCDQGRLYAAVHRVLNVGKGNFGLLLGGESTGKSLILRKLAEDRHKQHKDSVLLINGRLSAANLMQGIVTALSSKDWKRWAAPLFHVADVSVSATRTFHAQREPDIVNAAEAFYVPARNVILAPKRGVTAELLIWMFVEMHHKRGRTPCIIIDQANLALPDGSPGEIEQTKAMLHQFVSLTRQEHKLNVLLACSGHAESLRLQQLGFDAMDFGRHIFASEVPPAKMVAQLKKLEFGDNLAGMLVGIFGGHVWALYQAVSGLAADPNFTPMHALCATPISAVDVCVKAEEAKEKGMHGTRKLLQKLAETGFAPLPNEGDPRAERLSRGSVAGIANAFSVTVGVPPQFWVENDFGLVPARQSTRLLTARVLNRGI